MSHADPDTPSGPHHNDGIHNVDNPFATPGATSPNHNAARSAVSNSGPGSVNGASAFSSGYNPFPRGVYFRSRRIKKEAFERPWLDNKHPREKWMTILPLVGLFIGLCITAVLVWDGVRSVAQHKYCEIFTDDFSSWNSSVWTKEVEVGGYG
jgi:hypothetical protein